jgi:hypothetical protein
VLLQQEASNVLLPGGQRKKTTAAIATVAQIMLPTGPEHTLAQEPYRKIWGEDVAHCNVTSG